MATEVLMPRQGQSVESCIIIEWKVKEGDTVTEGQALCEVETDKATFEVESPAAGTVLGVFYPQDADVPVLNVIAAIGEPGEDVSAMRPDESTSGDGGQDSERSEPKPEVQQTAPAATDEEPAASVQPAGTGASPRAKGLASEQGVEISALPGSGPEGRVIERDVKAALEGRSPLSPAAKDKAAVDGMAVPATGSGVGGRILTSDLHSQPVATGGGTAVDFPGPATEIPVKGVRKVVAERMMASLQGSAQLTLNTSADARSLLAYRGKCKAAPEETGIGGISLNDLVLFATARTLKDFPELNAHWLGEKMVQFQHVHLGFAVDTPRGLMVPTIRYADQLTLKQLSAETKRLAKACMDGTIDPDALGGGTFTVTNLGAAGIESFTPVLNTPQVGILGICSIEPKPVMKKDGGVEFLPHMGLSLTFDHRAVDGAPAARFLVAIRSQLATIELTLAS